MNTLKHITAALLLSTTSILSTAAHADITTTSGRVIRKLTAPVARLLSSRPIPKRSLLLLLATLIVTPAQAVTVNIGFFEESSGQTVVRPLFTTGEGVHSSGPIYQYTGNWGGDLIWKADSVANIYEFVATDIFNTRPDTIRFYATFSGITTPASQLTIPSYFEGQTQPGATVVDQVFICGASAALFCDNYPGLGNQGTFLGGHTFLSTADLDATLTGMAPGSPYDITLVLHFASSLNTNDNLIDLGAVNLVDPHAVSPVPGPIVGAGIPGLAAMFTLLFGWLGWWRRREKNA
jgi:hypothetical protein